MWKMLPLARKILKKKTKRVFEGGSIAKKGEKIAKINPRKEKS